MTSDGNTIAIVKTGFVEVYTYHRSSRDWVQIGTDIVLDDANSLAMSADGKMIVVGLLVPDNINGGASSASVVVYAFDSTVRNWIQIGSDIESEVTQYRFGASVAMSADGKTIAFNNFYIADERYRGYVHVYAYNPIAKAWLQVGNKIDWENVSGNNDSFFEMSADGKTIALGAGGNLQYAGHVRLYSISSVTKKWTQMGSAIDVFSSFTMDMSANGKSIAIGLNRRSIRVYTFNNVLGSWKQVGNDFYGEATDDSFGNRIVMSNDGKTVAVSGPYNDNPNGEDSGHVRVYSYIASTKIWTQLGSDLNGMKDFDYSGDVLAMSADGSSIIIGAPFGDEGNYVGYARVYKYQPPQDCTVSWKLYDMQSNTIVDSLVNGTKIRNPPPCGYANIEAYVPCANMTSHVVTIELYNRNDKLYKTRTDMKSPYFLYGKNGKIKSGKYTIRAIVNSTTISPYTSIVSPYTKFTLLRNCT